jgi:hypothetical protein
VITWNGKQGEALSMRVIKGSIFERTYQLLDETLITRPNSLTCSRWSGSHPSA